MTIPRSVEGFRRKISAIFSTSCIVSRSNLIVIALVRGIIFSSKIYFIYKLKRVRSTRGYIINFKNYFFPNYSLSDGMEMLRYEKITFLFIFLLLIITFLSPITSVNPLISSFDIDNTNKKVFITNNISNSLESVNEATDDNAFLPRSNLTVSEYLGDWETGGYELVSNYNISILSLNSTHIKVLCDYDKETDIDGTPIPSSFYSFVNRTSIQPYYNVSNYYGLFFCYKQDIFDFWIDESNFSIGNTFVIQYTPQLSIVLTISETSLNLAGVGTFNAWKLSGTDPYSNPVAVYYEKNTGLFLSQYFVFISPIWLNLTKAEISQIPMEYDGAIIKSLSPKNNSARPSSAPVICDLESLYGIDEIFYQWDEGINRSTDLSTIETNFPLSNGSHYLYITAIDNLFKVKYYIFHFITDNTLPGILLEAYKNNSQLKGNFSLKINITSSNNSFLYNWDASPNMTIIGTGSDFIGTITTPQPEGLHILSIYVKSIAGVWSMIIYHLTIDNTPPIIYLKDFINKTTLKDSLILKYNVSESCSIRYSLDNGTQEIIQADPFEDYSLSFLNLANGSHTLNLNTTDLANNSESTLLLFNIHAGVLDWPINVSAEQPNSLRVIDSDGKYWFTLIVASKINQRYTVSLPKEGVQSTPENMLFITSFICDEPNEIILVTFIYPITNSSESTPNFIEVYQWNYWDVNKQEWVGIETIFNNIKNQWEATIERGDFQFFALIKTGDTTTLESIVPGGGQIYSFELPIVLTALLLCYKRRKKNIIK